MTTREAAIVSLYTGFLIGEFAEMQKLVVELVGREVWSHELAGEAFVEACRKKAKPLFVAIEVK